MAKTLAFALYLVIPFIQNAKAGVHEWDINEVYSNEDGTIQFIELANHLGPGCDSEHFFNGDAFSSNSNVYPYPANLPSSDTCGKKVLLATAGFAALAGAPAPDFVIPDQFFDPTGDSINHASFDFISFG